MTAVDETMGGGETKEKLYSTLLWRIENISYWEPEYCKHIESPHFEFPNAGTCHLFLCLKGEKDYKKFACCLWFHKNISSLDYEWSLLNGDGLPLVARMIRNATMKFNQQVDLLDWPTYEDVFRVKKSSFLTNDSLILRCRFWNSNKDLKQAEYLSGCTRIKTAETSFLWQIKKFSGLQLDQKLITPFVLQFSEEKVTFKLRFSLKGDSLTNAVMSFEITQKDRNTSQRLTTTLSILDHEERIVKSFTSKSNFKISNQSSEQVCCLPKFVSRQKVMKRESDWLHDDVLTLLCKFHSVKKQMEYRINKRYKGPENMKRGTVRTNRNVLKVTSIETKITDLSCAKSTAAEEFSQTPHQCDGTNIPQHKTKSMATFQENFLSLYTDHTLSDFELRSGDASIHVHKMVLIARSPVFKAMFCGEMNETSSDFLDVPEIDVDTLNRMLTFMYTGTLNHLDWESAAKLFFAADRYQVQSLKEECLYLLQTGTSVRNVSDILELADRYQDKDLELFVHGFLISHFDEVVLSENWEKFLDRNRTLAGKAMREVYKKKLQKDCN